MIRKEGGYATLTDRETGKVVAEASTYSCNHCNRITHVKAKQDPAEIGGLCKSCMGLICQFCLGQPCVPLMKRIEAEEASYHARRSYGF